MYERLSYYNEHPAAIKGMYGSRSSRESIDHSASQLTSGRLGSSSTARKSRARTQALGRAKPFLATTKTTKKHTSMRFNPDPASLSGGRVYPTQCSTQRMSQLYSP